MRTTGSARAEVGGGEEGGPGLGPARRGGNPLVSLRPTTTPLTSVPTKNSRDPWAKSGPCRAPRPTSSHLQRLSAISQRGQAGPLRFVVQSEAVQVATATERRHAAGRSDTTSSHLWQIDVVRLLTFTAVIAVHSLASTEQPDNRVAAGAMMLLPWATGQHEFVASSLHGSASAM
jgi:hypothetical protein